MVIAFAVGWALAAQAGYAATFADAWDRWRSLDATWALASNPARRTEALPRLRQAAALLFGNRWSEACQALDAAWAELEGRRPSPDQAAILRFRPPVAEPGQPARLEVDWAYRPTDLSPLRLKIGNREAVLHPGRKLTLEVRPDRLEPELSRTPELGLLVTAQVGSGSRSIPLSIVKSARSRMMRLLESDDEAARMLGEQIRLLFETPGSLDPGRSIGALLAVGESLASREVSIQRLDAVPYARQGATSLRVEFPKGVADVPAVVIAVSGFGGEGAFFECLGQGRAAAEASRRGWGFVGAADTEHAVRDALAWLERHRRAPFGRYFVLGAGRGAGSAAAAAELRRKPAAMALLAPASTGVLAAWLTGPVYFAIGKEDVARIVGTVRNIVTELGARPDLKLDEYEGVEHLMLPAEAIPAAFTFFDRFAK